MKVDTQPNPAVTLVVSELFERVIISDSLTLSRLLLLANRGTRNQKSRLLLLFLILLLRKLLLLFLLLFFLLFLLIPLLALIEHVLELFFRFLSLFIF